MPDEYIPEPTAEEAYAIDNNPAPVQDEVAAPNEDASTSFERRLIAVQRRLKAPKNQYNHFGKFSYRNCEDILEGLKPLLDEYDILLTIDNEIAYIQGYFYVKATAKAKDPVTGLSVSAVAFAREPAQKKGMDDSQVTGTASSYANKRALGNLFLIDDTKDADFEEPKQQRQRKPKEPPVGENFTAHCESCGTRYTFNDADYYRQFIQAPNCCQNPRWVVE